MSDMKSLGAIQIKRLGASSHDSAANRLSRGRRGGFRCPKPWRSIPHILLHHLLKIIIFFYRKDLQSGLGFERRRAEEDKGWNYKRFVRFYLFIFELFDRWTLTVNTLAVVYFMEIIAFFFP